MGYKAKKTIERFGGRHCVIANIGMRVQELRLKAERLEAQVKKVQTDREADRLEAKERRAMYSALTRASG
jgi:hypothetical protein